MKKNYKKLSIVFVMAFAIILGCFGNNVFAADGQVAPKKDYSSNLIANYKLDETSGTTCIDSTKNGNDGIYHGTKVSEDGNGRTFNGTSDYIEFNKPIIPTSKLSIKFKIKIASKPTDSSPTIMSTLGSDNLNGLQIHVSTGALILREQHNGGNIYANGFDDSIFDREWHTVLCTFDSSIGTNNMKLYIDDMITPKAVATYPYGNIVNATNLVIGQRYGILEGHYFNGSLDDIEIYNDVVEYEVKSTTPTDPTQPTDNSGKAILTITMTNGMEKEYDLSMTEVNKFISWYNGRVAGTGNAYYTFNKNGSLAAFTKRTEYILYDKIVEFNVDEYTK